MIIIISIKFISSAEIHVVSIWGNSIFLDDHAAESTLPWVWVFTAKVMIKAKFKVVICGYFECYGFLMIRTSEAPGKQIGLDKYYQWPAV